MEATKIEKQILKYTKDLPQEALQEILDYIKFIRTRKLKSSSDDLSRELSYLDRLETKRLEEEFKNYKELYPKNG